MRSKIFFLYVLGFALSIAPITVYLMLNFDRYVKNGYDGFKLAAGGVILCVILALKIIGRLKIPSAVSVFAVIFILSYLLSSILNDLMIFSFLALLGEMLEVFTSVPIRKMKLNEGRQRQAEITAQQVVKAINGRV